MGRRHGIWRDWGQKGVHLPGAWVSKYGERYCGRPWCANVKITTATWGTQCGNEQRLCFFHHISIITRMPNACRMKLQRGGYSLDCDVCQMLLECRNEGQGRISALSSLNTEMELTAPVLRSQGSQDWQGSLSSGDQHYLCEKLLKFVMVLMKKSPMTSN